MFSSLRLLQFCAGTNRMGHKAATSFLYFSEDTAWDQAGCGAAKDNSFIHKAFNFLKDALFNFELLEYALLEHK